MKITHEEAKHIVWDRFVVSRLTRADWLLFRGKDASTQARAFTVRRTEWSEFGCYSGKHTFLVRLPVEAVQLSSSEKT